MIPVREQPEPADFITKVSGPGANFLATALHPKDWSGRDYWLKAFEQLYDAYGGICAYCAQWMPRDIGRTTVDHYIPKSIAPNLAYEWTNYRLAAGLYNSRKRDFLDVLDPFQIGYRWFILDIPSLQVKPNPKLNPSESRLVQATINRLKLNDETSIRGRRNWLNPLIQGKITFDYLRERAPFLAQELEVSALTAAATLRTVFKFPEYLTAQAPSTNGQPHST